MNHYLLLTLPDGKDSVRREYLPLLTEDETIEEALDRWVEQHPDMWPDGKARVRNRDKVSEAVRNSPLSLRLCRPSSWYRENGLGAHAKSGEKKSTIKRGKKS